VKTKLHLQHIDPRSERFPGPQAERFPGPQAERLPGPQADEPPGAAPLLVILHGFLGCSADLDAVAREAAVRSGCQALLPDLPGHGRSAHVMPVSLGHTATLVWDAIHAHPAAKRCGSAPARVLLAGYSMGGRVALAMAHARPDVADGLFIESAHPGLTTAGDRRARARHDTEMALRLQRTTTKADLRAFLTDWYRQSVFLHDGRPADTFTQRVEDRLDSILPRGAPCADLSARVAPLAAALRAHSLAAQPDFWSVPHRFGGRGWYVSGSRDHRYDDVGRRLAGNPSGVHHVPVPDAGHTVHRDAPDAYLQALQSFVTTCIS